MSCLPQAEDKISCLTWEKIELNKLLTKAQDPGAGGIVIFSGEVRNLNNGKVVTHLEYEAELTMAELMIQDITARAVEEFGLFSAYCVHRLGTVGIGQSAVIVITSHVHRKEAYRANEYIIDKVKHEVPIWKKEFYADGTSTWGNNCNCH